MCILERAIVKSLSNLKNVPKLRLHSKVPSSPWLFSNYGFSSFLIPGYFSGWRLIFKFIQTLDSNFKIETCSRMRMSMILDLSRSSSFCLCVTEPNSGYLQGVLFLFVCFFLLSLNTEQHKQCLSWSLVSLTDSQIHVLVVDSCQGAEMGISFCR